MTTNEEQKSAEATIKLDTSDIEGALSDFKREVTDRVSGHLFTIYFAISLLFVLLVLHLFINHAHAERPNAKVTARRGYSMTFRIKFPWGTCTTRYYHPTVRYPLILRGLACGTRTTCYRVRKGPKYNCFY